MEKKINVVVTIDKTEMSKKEKLERLARYLILINKWKKEKISKKDVSHLPLIKE